MVLHMGLFGIGPIVSFISSELVSQRHRSLIQSVCLGINFSAVIISTFTILPLFSAIKAYAFLILYVLPCSFSILILFAKLPETKGREIHEIVAQLRGKKHLSKFDRLIIKLKADE
uniref:Major facilitator superfamily (MFS) profile domain-containing protein n=1 Tax=Panagrolaimus superbus TaxID=310955 RepID=A0A914Z0D1_9BILA